MITDLTARGMIVDYNDLSLPGNVEGSDPHSTHRAAFIFLFPMGVKWPGREADHTPQTGAKVKNAWSYTSTLPIHIHGMVLS
jgi:hypothetical protein